MENKLLNDSELKKVTGGADKSSWDYISEARTLLTSFGSDPENLKAGIWRDFGDHKIEFTELKYDGFACSYTFVVIDLAGNEIFRSSEADFVL